MTIASMMKRLAVSLSLALLAAASPPLRTAVLDWIGAADLVAPTSTGQFNEMG